MKLIKHLQQGKLLFLQDQGFRLTVEENLYFRWMSFNDLPQSVMHLRHPHWLTLPHHFYLILPLAFINPKRIIEIGLGGGNLSRYLSVLLPKSQLTSFESEPVVIECFHDYFQPCHYLNHTTILPQSDTDIITKARDASWLIYDVFSTKIEQGIDVSLISSLLNTMPNKSWFTLNLPNLTASKLDWVLRELSKLQETKSMYYFFVPHYKNIIVHIGNNAGYKHETVLPARTLKRIKSLWRHACLDRQLKGNRAIV